MDYLLMDRCSSQTISGFLCLFQNTCNIHPNWSNLIYRKAEQWLFSRLKIFHFPAIDIHEFTSVSKHSCLVVVVVVVLLSDGVPL